MHERRLSADRDLCPRTGATTGTRAGDRAGFRGSATPTPESRSTVCGVEEPDRTAQGALTENEACSRTILSRGYSAELETTGTLPKIEISRISHGSRSEIEKRKRDAPTGKQKPRSKLLTAGDFLETHPCFATPIWENVHLRLSALNALNRARGFSLEMPRSMYHDT